MDQLTIAITEMDNMTQQNAALVEETASASEEMANQAQELLAMTQQFKTGNGTAGTFAKKEIHLKNLSRRDSEKRNGGNGHDHSGNGNGDHKKSLEHPAMKHEGSGLNSSMKEEGFEEF